MRKSAICQIAAAGRVECRHFSVPLQHLYAEPFCLISFLPFQPEVSNVIDLEGALESGGMQQLDENTANVFTKNELELQDHTQKHDTYATELKYRIQRVLHHPVFNTNEVDHHMQQRLMKVVEDGGVEVVDRWEEGDGLQDVTVIL